MTATLSPSGFLRFPAPDGMPLLEWPGCPGRASLRVGLGPWGVEAFFATADFDGEPGHQPPGVGELKAAAESLEGRADPAAVLDLLPAEVGQRWRALAAAVDAGGVRRDPADAVQSLALRAGWLRLVLPKGAPVGLDEARRNKIGVLAVTARGRLLLGEG